MESLKKIEPRTFVMLCSDYSKRVRIVSNPLKKRKNKKRKQKHKFVLGWEATASQTSPLNGFGRGAAAPWTPRTQKIVVYIKKPCFFFHQHILSNLPLIELVVVKKIEIEILSLFYYSWTLF